MFNNNNLETIQEWCESLAELIWLNRQQIKEIELLKQRLPLDQPIDVLPQLMADITQLLSSLVTSTFIIEKQPPQVMKTNTRYCMFIIVQIVFYIAIVFVVDLRQQFVCWLVVN